MSGDMRVRSNIDGALGGAGKLEHIDAHSSQSGDFSEARQVGGKEVFFTPDGAALYDELAAAGFRFEASDDASWLTRFLSPKESCTGEVER